MLRPATMFLAASVALFGACRIAGDPIATTTTTTTTTTAALPTGKGPTAAPVKIVPLAVHAAPAADHRAEWRAFLAQARRTQMDRIHDYRIRGEFPINRVRAGKLNVFVDDRTGALCAVANLIAQSGHRDLVDQTAASNNFIRLADVSSGPLVDWILTSGLTHEEVVFIQEPYEYQGQVEPPAADPVDLPVSGVEPAAASPRVVEKQRLRRHFVAVERRLSSDFERSIDLAMSRLPASLLASAPRV